MNRQMFEQWMEKYIRRQEQGDPEVIKELWAQDGVYWWGPFQEPRHGMQAVYEHHKNALSHQSAWKCDYTVLATSENCGVARFRLTLNDHTPGEPNTYDGIFLVHLNDEGKCTLFEEWYHSTTT